MMREAHALRSEQTGPVETDFSKYAEDPIGYCEKELGIFLTPDQQQILVALRQPPFKVLVPSANTVGKSYVAACAINWWFDCRGPGIVISTAPTDRHVKEVLWSNVRLQRHKARLPDYFIGPSAPEMRRDWDWYALGFTAARGEAFQGRHRDRMLFIFDEATAIEPLFWERLRTMFDPNPEAGHAWLAIFNPLRTTCQAYVEDNLVDEEPDNPPWTRVRISAMNHPNIAAELKGLPRPFPGAVGVHVIEEWIRASCELVERLEDVVATDVEWPPSSITGQPGKWYRPGPEFQSAVLGLWPDAGDNIWSDALWHACAEGEPSMPRDNQLPQLGVDTAMGKGEDYHAIHGRWGSVSFHHETANTMDPVRIAARIREACQKAADFVNSRRPVTMVKVEPKNIAVKIDDDGTGNAILALLRREGFNIVPIGAGCMATNPKLYPRRRDELWFATADRAKKGGVNLHFLDRPTKLRLKQQLMNVSWDQDVAGRRRVEPKKDTKEKLGRSPDDADAFNLAYHDPSFAVISAVDPEPQEETQDRGHFAKNRGRWA